MLGHTARGDERLTGWRRLVAAYDVDRQLERGYTLTLGPDGDLIRSAADVAPDGALVTMFADGTVRSRVEATEMKEEQ